MAISSDIIILHKHELCSCWGTFHTTIFYFICLTKVDSKWTDRKLCNTKQPILSIQTRQLVAYFSYLQDWIIQQHWRAYTFWRKWYWEANMDVNINHLLAADEDLLLFVNIMLCVTILCITLQFCWGCFKYSSVSGNVLEENDRKASSGGARWNTSALHPKLPSVLYVWCLW